MKITRFSKRPSNKARRISCTRIGTCALAVFVVIPLDSIAKSSRIGATQLVRYALESTRFRGYVAYKRSVIKGTLVYDNEYRHPNDPPGPTPVDCTRTGRIGVTFLLTRRFNLSEEAIRLEVRWIHSGLQEGKSIVENGTSVFWRGVDGVIDSWGIPLTDERKIEGVVTVRIKANGTEVLENSFKLVGCPKAAAQVINY